MIDPAFAVQLAQAGGWAVAILMGTAFAAAIVRGWLVAGFVYRREVKRGDDATAALRSLLESIADGRRPSTRPQRESVRDA